MVVPSRKNKMMLNIISDQNRKKNMLKAEHKSEKVDPEEHEERIKMLKKMGLIKEK